jgi:hypothetical protein
VVRVYTDDRCADLKPAVELCHLFGVFPLGYPDALLHLLGLGLDIFPNSDEFVDGGFKCAYERFRVKG